MGKQQRHEHHIFIERGQLSQGRKATYVKAVCDIRPQKEETHRVRHTAGGPTSPPSRHIGTV
eukprot:scaffold37188_cov29-Attheya_sp.AAC.3